MRKRIFLIPFLSIGLSGCFDNDQYVIENGVRLNKKTGEMSLIIGDSYKKLEEFKVTQTESEPKHWGPLEILFENTKVGKINLSTKYKDGFILYQAVLFANDLNDDNQSFRKKYISSSITVNFEDKDGFKTDSSIELEMGKAISNSSTEKGKINFYWQAKIPSTLKNYEAASNTSLQWRGF